MHPIYLREIRDLGSTATMLRAVPDQPRRQVETNGSHLASDRYHQCGRLSWGNMTRTRRGTAEEPCATSVNSGVGVSCMEQPKRIFRHQSRYLCEPSHTILLSLQFLHTP